MRGLISFAMMAVLVCTVAGRVTQDDSVSQTSMVNELVKEVKVRGLAAVVAEEPLNVTEWEGLNPCEVTRNFNYYIAYPNDTTRYIQCDPWGTGVIKTCGKGNVWNMWSLTCDLPEKIRNTTFILPHRVFNCSLSGHECLNAGVCTESSLGGDRCVCKPDWTGPTCESRVDLDDLTHEILNGTFSIHKYREQLQALNITVDVAEYVRFKDQLDNVTYEALIHYMSLYKGREVRYDTLINNLVESILQDIYPDAAYLSTFNASAISVVDLVQLIPNLMSYSKYSLERYQDVFAKYQQVLTSLVNYLNSTHNSHPRLREEAIEYTELTAIFMNQTLALVNQTGVANQSADNSFSSIIGGHPEATQQQQLSEEQIREHLGAQFNLTMNATIRLYDSLERFQNEVMDLVKNGTRDVFTLTLDQCNLQGTEEVKKMLDEITNSSMHVWDALVNYGFWFITGMFTTPLHVLAEQHSVLMEAVANHTAAALSNGTA